jgi:hypothetical protein
LWSFVALSSILPDNDLHFEDSFMSGNVTQDEFNATIDKFLEIYSPIVKSFGKSLVVERAWSDSTVNAYAWQSGNTWYIKMFGGLARRPEINVDGFALVLCHEMGHHVAGYPKYPNNWAANEGQSDYFATHACARKMFGGESRGEGEEVEIDYYLSVFNTNDNMTDTAYQTCYRYLSTPSDRLVCRRSLLGSVGLARLLSRSGRVAINTPSRVVVKKTLDSHPAGQCRLDTYVAGAICNKEWNDYVIPATARHSEEYLCTRRHDKKRQSRPLCWFKP